MTTLGARPAEAVAGLVTVLLGVPLCAVLRSSSQPPSAARHQAWPGPFAKRPSEPAADRGPETVSGAGAVRRRSLV